MSATSCWVKWREALVSVWREGRHLRTDEPHVQTMENASLNRLWLNRWWLKFHYRQEGNYSLSPELGGSALSWFHPQCILLFCGWVNTFLLLSLVDLSCTHLYLSILPHILMHLFQNQEDSLATHGIVELSSCFLSPLNVRVSAYCRAAIKSYYPLNRHQ